MADENLDIRARLTAEDQMSPVFKRVIGQFEAAKKAFDNSFAKTRINEVISQKSLEKLSSGQKKLVNGVTDAYVRQAKAIKEAGQMSATGWTDTQRAAVNAINTWNRSSGRMKAIRKAEAQEAVKQAQAYAYVWNNAFSQRQKLHGRMFDYINKAEAMSEKMSFDRGVRQTRAEARELRQREREHARSLRQQEMEQRRADRESARSSRMRWNGLSQMRQGGERMVSGARQASWYALAATGGATALGRSSVMSARDLDRAETNARMNMDQSVDIPGIGKGARALRDNWALGKSVSIGVNPATLLGTAVDASKAGVPEKLAAGTAELVTQLAKTMAIPVEQAMDGMGYAIAQELGAGRMNGDNITGIRSLGNITAYLANKTAARPDQMFSFLRTGLGSGAMLGMNNASTMAFGAAAIQAGAQGQQAARMLGSMGEDINGLQNRYKDTQRKSTKSEDDKLFLRLPSMLGYGSFSGIQQSFKQDPNNAIFKLLKSFGNIKDPFKRNQAMTSMFGADFARFSSNMIASPGVLDNSIKLANEAASQKEGADFVSESWGEFTSSLEFFLDRVKATWGVVKSELGDVLKPFIQQFSDWVGDWYNAVKTSGIKERLKGFLDGLTRGFLGKDGSFRDLLDATFGKPGSQSSVNVDSFFKFAKGFAEGIKDVAATVTSTMKELARLTGKDASDPEAMGKFTAQIMGFVIALNALGPLLPILTGLVTFIGGLVAVLGGPVAAGVAAATAAEVLGPQAAKKRPGETTNQYRERRRQEKDKLYKRSSYSGEGVDTNLIHKTSISSSVDDLTEQMKQFGGNVQKASLISGITDFSAARRIGSSGGVALGGGGGGSLGGGLGNAGDLIRSTPGGVLPNVGSIAGPMIKRGGINPTPSFGGTGSGSNDGVGAGLTGSAFLAARRQKFAKELENDPSLRMHIAAMQATEGISGGGTVESLMNRADMQGKTLRQMLGYSADGQINPKSFYGPIRRGELGPAIERLKRNPKEFAKYDGATNRALAGGHVIGGYTDQGLPTDPNGSRRTGIPGFKISPKDGNEFTDWVGPGSSWGKGRNGAMNYRKFIEQGIAGEGAAAAVPGAPSVGQNVPKSVIDNVPPAGTANGVDAMTRASLGGGNSGPVAIHINGHTGDPEVLANQVQRRIEEAMNWRTHDMESQAV